MAKKKSPILIDKYEKIIAEMDGEDVKQIILAIYAYNRCEDKAGFSFDFTTATAKMIFMAMQNDYDSIEKYKERQREHGARGGNPTLNQPLSDPYPTLKGTLTQPYPKGKDKDKDKDNLKKDTPIGVSKEKPAKAEPVRHKYGEYENVMLTDEQYEELKDKFPSDYKERIERLSEYMSSTGKVYKNHLTTIKVWARMEKERGKPAPGRARAAPNRSFRSGQEDIYSDDIYEVF